MPSIEHTSLAATKICDVERSYPCDPGNDVLATFRALGHACAAIGAGIVRGLGVLNFLEARLH